MAERLIERGEIYWVNFPDSNGRELKEIHPALVISNNKQNRFSPLMVVIPITSLKENEEVFSFQLLIKLKKESIILVDQIRTIDRNKFGDKISELGEEVMEKIEKRIHLVLALKS
jgi:mRNA interferase MazF